MYANPFTAPITFTESPALKRRPAEYQTVHVCPCCSRFIQPQALRVHPEDVAALAAMVVPASTADVTFTLPAAE